MNRDLSKKFMLKKASMFCLVGIMTFGLAACGKKTDKTDSANKPPVAEQAQKESSSANIGEFETTDLEKNKVTQEVFRENDLTMVNMFSSTCNPCMEELPYLAELAKEYKDKKVGILGVDIDMDSKGKPDEESREIVSKILKDKKSEMKVIFLDENLINTLLKKTDALPYTFFVNKNGDIVGEEYLGSRSKEEWANVIDKEFDKISKNK